MATPQEEPVQTPEPEPVSTPEPAPSLRDDIAAASTPAPQNQFLSSLKERGFDFGPDVADDSAAFAALQRQRQEYQQLQQQYQQIQPYAQTFIQNYDRFAPLLQGQPQQPQPTGASKDPYWKSMWNAPEYNPDWRNQVTQDANGNLVPKPGAPPNVAHKLLEYTAWRQQNAEKFFDNPITFMEPAVKHLAAEIAQQEIQKHLGGYKDQQFAQQFVQQNQSWLYNLDPQGQPKVAPQFNPMTGQWEQRREFSDWGRMLHQSIEQEAARQQRYGYQDVQEQQQRAMQQVQLQYAMTQLQQMQALLQQKGIQMPGQAPPAGQPQPTPAQTPREQANDQFDRGQRIARQPRPANNAESPQPVGRLKDMLKRNLDAAGVTTL